MEIISYISINLLLFSSWYILLYRKKGFLSFVDRLIGTFIAGLCQIIVTEMLLGAVFKQLFSAPLFFLNALISAALLTFAVLTGGNRGIFADFRDEVSKICRVIYSDKILLCIFGFFLISVCWLIFLGYLFPSYSWDALYYHLPIAGQIIQSGAIQEHPTPSFIQQYINIFSKNINLFFVWNIIFLKSDIIVDISQLFFTIAGVLSIYSMAVKLGIRDKYAIYSALLFFFTPVIILQSTINYVDGAVSMLFLISINFLLYDYGGSPDVNKSKTPLLLSGLTAGILLGSKPTGPVFIAVLMGVFFIRGAIRHCGQSRMSKGTAGHTLKKELLTYLICFILPVFIMGGYWYMRNWIFYGNPVYYMDVSIFNITLFKGMKSDWVESAPPIIESLNYMSSLIYVWMEKVGYYMYDSRLSGFGPIWFILFLPAVIISLIHAVSRKKYGFLFISTILLITFLIHPRNWTSRYVMFIVGLGALSFGYVLDYFSHRDKLLKIIALMLAGYTFMTTNSPCIMPGQIREFLAMPPHERTVSRLKPFNIDEKVQKEYGHWMWIEKNIAKGDTLAYTFESFNLDTSHPFFTAKLWNNEFSNRVVYIKSDTYKEWLNELTNNNTSYILIKNGSLEDGWIEKERKLFYSLRWMGNIKEKFKIVYSDYLYKIVQYKGNPG